MKVTSRKDGASRERVEADFDCIPVATWRVEWEPGPDGTMKHAGRSIHLSSPWGGERAYEVRLSEHEAIAIAKAVVEDLLTAASTKLFEELAAK